MSEHDELQQLLTEAPEKERGKRVPPAPNQCSDKAAECPTTAPRSVDFCQWELWPNGSFLATGATRSNLPVGVYRLDDTPRGIFFTKANVQTDKLIDLHDSAAEEILEGIRKFRRSKESFDQLGFLYKRGVLLWGPPGSGKTATVQRLIVELVQEGGFVILCDNPKLTIMALAQVRQIEPDRMLAVVEEDIEEMISNYGEHSLLSLLDGENQIPNVIHIATTNFPELLGARIINRPSRFDEVKKIGMPNAVARRCYLEAVVNGRVAGGELDQWVRDTDGMSIAHLRELVVSILCLERDYSDTIERLKKMAIKPKSHEDGFNRGQNIGMGAGISKQLLEPATQCAPSSGNGWR